MRLLCNNGVIRSCFGACTWTCDVKDMCNTLEHCIHTFPLLPIPAFFLSPLIQSYRVVMVDAFQDFKIKMLAFEDDLGQHLGKLKWKMG